jgi:hypothetical protein
MTSLACFSGLSRPLNSSQCIRSPSPPPPPPRAQVPACNKRHTLAVTFGHGLRRAASNGHVQVMKRLLGAGARLDTRSGSEDFLHRTSLHVAAAGGHEAAVRLILAQCKERQVRVVLLLFLR